MASPTLEELHARVRAFVAARDWAQYHSPRNLAMALSVEASELLELFLWTRDDAEPTVEGTARAADEAADVMICLLNFCERSGIDLGAAVADKLARAELKYPAEQVRGKALKYDAYPTWDGERHRHVLRADRSPADLPEDARDWLVTRGVPAELKLAGWVGPTLFTSAIGGGAMDHTAWPGGQGYVLGGMDHGRFVVRPTGEVVLVDDQVTRVANRSVPVFFQALELFHAGFGAGDHRALLDRVRAVDPTSYDALDGWWATWAETLL